MRAINFSLILFIVCLLPFPTLPAMQADELPESVVIRGLWRSGEMMRYELNEYTEIYNNGSLVEERELSTLVNIDVAARRPGDSYVLLWQVLETNAPLFNDPELDKHMYGHLNDGIVVHTDQFGGYDHSSNMEELHAYFVNAVQELDRQNYWSGKGDAHAQLTAYKDDISLFESLLLRDMKFMFGLHGVDVYLEEVYTYSTWQDNPWGEPISSEGKLYLDGYDEQTRLLTILNEVSMSASDLKQDEIRLAEDQRYVIQARTGWPHEVELNDEITRGEFHRTRRLAITHVEF